MATLITKNSSTASSVPTAAQLVQGELAVNVTDKRLFTENSSGTVVELGTNPSTLALPNGTANGVAYLNGSKVLTTGSALTFDGTNLVNTAGSVRLTNASGYFETALSYYLNAGGGGGFQLKGLGSGVQGIAFLDAGAGTEYMRLTSTGLGIGTSSPAYKLDVAGTFRTTGIAYLGDATTTLIASIGNSGSSGVKIVQFQRATGTGDNVNIQGINTGVGAADIGMQVSGGNLGIGTASPAYKLDVSTASGNAYANVGRASKTTGQVALQLSGGTSGTNWIIYQPANSDNLTFFGNSADRMVLDTSGNLGLGVTPSAWVTAAGRKAIEIGALGNALFGAGAADFSMLSNAYINTSSQTTYANNGAAARYQHADGAHRFYTAPSGTAGNAISFTQAMTLDSGGDLLVGATSGISSERLTLQNPGGNASFMLATDGTGQYYAGVLSDSTSFSGSRSNHAYRFYTNDTERARITSGGYFKASNNGSYFGITGAYHELRGDSTGRLFIFENYSASGAVGGRIYYSAQAPNNTGAEFLYCSDTGGERASIRSNGGLANYSGNNVNLSDRREKTNLAPAKSYLDTICAIPVQTFNYIDQSEDDPGLTLGVVAQDVQAVAPELVMESNWGTEDNPKMRLSIYQTDLQYALMKALQELKAEFDAYKATHP